MVNDFLKRIRVLRRRTKVIALVLALLAIFLILKGRQRPNEIKFASVSRGDIEYSISASGILSGKKVATLRFNQAGKLNSLNFKNGDFVTKGQVIATLDSTQASVVLQEALNNRRNTQAALDGIYDQIKGHGGDETFEQRAQRTAAEVANDNAYDSVRAAQKALDDTRILAPFNGVIVINNDISVGQNVGLSDVIGRVVDFSEKEMDATIDESDIGEIKLGQKARVKLNAYGDREFWGTVSEITPSTQTDSVGAVTVSVKIKLDDSDIVGIYGLNGNVDIVVSSKSGILKIPQDALIDDRHVFLKGVGGKIEKKEIETGIKSDTEVEVSAGLSEGDQVVTNPWDVKAN